MIKTYFKTAWRYLMNNRVTTFISVTGLAVGICCFLLLATYLINELRYDKFHVNAARIVRVDNHFQSANDDHSNDVAVTPTAVVPEFKRQIAEVEDGARVYNYSDGRPVTVQYGDNVFNEKSMLLADDSFFKIFSFTFLKGNAQSAMTDPLAVVISESIAKKYFGSTDPMGKILKVNQKYNMVVSGVIADVPAYSHIKFDLMGNYDIMDRSKTRKWDSANDYSYLLLKPGISLKNAEKKMNAYADAATSNGTKSGYKSWFTLTPLTSIHLYSNLKDELEPSGSINYVYILSAVAVILLLLACINFLNLVTAKAAERAHEIGVRKVMGAERTQLFIQFIAEAGLITLFSLLIGIGLTWLSFSAFSNFTAQRLSFDTWQLSWLIGLLAALFVAVTFIAGTYPALYLSAFKPVVTMKGRGSNKSGNLRKGLVVFQFGISVFFIICTMIVGGQLHYIMHRNTGIDRSQVLVLDIGGMPFDKIQAYKTVLESQPNVMASTASYDSPVSIRGGYSITKAEGKSPDYRLSVTAIPVERNFINTLGIKIIQGSNFTLADEEQVNTTDDTKRRYSFIINETAARALGWKPEEAVGKAINMGDSRVGTIKAVTHDFNFASLHQEITPVVIFAEYYWFGKLLIKTSGKDMESTISNIQTSWKKFYPNVPFDYHFLDQEYDAMYRSEQRTGNILNVFTAVTIFISCLGLFGLAVFTTKQRFKEVSIRKVMGASVGSIVKLISGDFLKLVLISVLIASPLAWYVMNKWLLDFAYRINIPWWVFVLAGGLSILIAFLTVSIQSVKAALLNPVKSLRSE
ncbi:ABC transporter permease [Mucilaginibacter mali]|uniref:ABC transporter permease n=1 Tax=Mucilaginibacter mali TaxID=2740462 RepID=A0A7D4TNG7_9SPHI|nr:ABC transporter permease [Mucilaginibacter mali]QKJ29854.1 ABC transporter permease [Mucilaginibacter mali]